MPKGVRASARAKSAGDGEGAAAPAPLRWKKVAFLTIELGADGRTIRMTAPGIDEVMDRDAFGFALSRGRGAFDRAMHSGLFG